MNVATFVADVFAQQLPFRVEAYDGSVAEATTSTRGDPVTIKFLRRAALARIVTRPGELGLARAYVAGDLEVEGDLDALFDLPMPAARELFAPSRVRALLSLVGPEVLRPSAPPEIEAHPRGLLHSRARDRRAITHHYEVSNRFYEMVLGPTMTYSCAVFATPEESLETAQTRKVDLVARKLDLRPGMRLLDVGCGWGTMGIHAARHYGARVVGVTLSPAQQRYATEAARRAGVSELVDFRVQDFRDIDDGPFDAVSSIGMVEHVGRRSLPSYTQLVWNHLRPGGRYLNHAIARAVTSDGIRPSYAAEARRQIQVALGRRGPSRTRSPFIERYIFPDGELHEVGTLVSRFQTQGFEVRHLESLREHYALTLRRWVDNLTKRFDEAIDDVGAPRARAWHLYMAGSAAAFERHHLEIHQVLCVRPDDRRSGFALRPNFEPTS